MAKTNKHAVVFGAQATTAQLYPTQDTFEFDQGHVSKNQPITVLVLLIQSLGIITSQIFPNFRFSTGLTSLKMLVASKG